MSYAEAPESDAVADIAPEQAPPPRRIVERNRLDLIYYALAGFDLLTIAFTLMLSNYIMGLYEDSVTRSVAWSSRVGDLVRLVERAQETNAPGNDVFDSLNVNLERGRRDVALEAYHRQRDRVLEQLRNHVSLDARDAIVLTIEEADAHMQDMVREADAIFSDHARGDAEAAGRRMATMDRIYASLSRSLLSIINQARAAEDRNLQRQIGLAQSLRRLELLVMVLIFLIIIGVTLYGRRVGEVMRRTQDDRNEMLVELEAANEGLQEYADNVAHELRNPVNKMLVGSEVALSRTRTPEEYQDALVSVVEECQRLSSIVGSLLFLARARRTKIDLDVLSIDLGAELELIRSYFEATALEGGVRLTVACPKGVSLHADRTLLQRAVSNLVSNALSHTKAGGEVAIRVSETEHDVAIEVSDTGEGISEEAQARVFDRFYRVDTVRNPTSGRLGLGLPITKSIVDLHGGKIALRSQPGQGTSVTIVLPRD
ncbi:MAG: sensor histidine kinase [Hyphomonadaceae bacterium]